MYLEIIWRSRGTPRSWRTPLRWSNPLKSKGCLGGILRLSDPFPELPLFSFPLSFSPSYLWLCVLAFCLVLSDFSTSQPCPMHFTRLCRHWGIERAIVYIHSRALTHTINCHSMQCSIVQCSSSTTTQIYGLPHQPTNHNETAVNILPTTLIYMHISLSLLWNSTMFRFHFWWLVAVLASVFVSEECPLFKPELLRKFIFNLELWNWLVVFNFDLLNQFT